MEAIPSLELIRVIKLDELIALWSHGHGYFGKQQSIRIRLIPLSLPGIQLLLDSITEIFHPLPGPSSSLLQFLHFWGLSLG